MSVPLPSRRRLLKAAGATAALAATGPNLLLGQAKGANDRLRVGVMGLGRGQGHIRALLDVTNCEVAYVCDVDTNRLRTGLQTMRGKQEKIAEKVTDFRRMLDDPDIDAITIAAPNFWHAPATIYACRAGKHVYVEKPGSHSPWEAQRMVEVARETERKVQMGTQRRSYPGITEGIQKLREGAIGRLLYARCWYNGQRQSIGKGKPAEPPEYLDWELWQGPVPDRPYKDNLVHYNWHWHWEYGGGELANNGVHSLDVARWALDVDYPKRITCEGGRYHHDDDQETPDTCYACYDYGHVGMTWDSSSSHRRKPENFAFVTVYGEGGSMAFSTANYTIYDLDGKETARNRQNPSDVPHFQNFADAIREGAPLNQEIGDAQVSTMLCHLGNIAYRTDGAVRVNPDDGTLLEGEAGEALWKREAYRDTWSDL